MKTEISLLVCFSMAFMPGAVMSNIEKQVERAVHFVTQLDDSCVYSDGYVCTHNRGDDFDAAVDTRGLVPGVFLQAWAAAYQRFLEEDKLTGEQKKLKHYKVGFKQDGQQLLVLFRPLFLPQIEDGEIVGRLRATFGKEVKIMVDLESNEVESLLYGK